MKGQGEKTSLLNLKRYSAITIVFLAASAFFQPPHVPRARAHDGASEARLLEVGSEHAPVKPVDAPAELKIVSYNIRYRVGDELEELAGLLTTEDAHEGMTAAVEKRAPTFGGS